MKAASRFCTVAGRIPDSWARLPLRHLAIISVFSGLSGPFPAWFGRLAPTLEYLDLSPFYAYYGHNNLTGAGFHGGAWVVGLYTSAMGTGTVWVWGVRRPGCDACAWAGLPAKVRLPEDADYQCV